jgi:hypothetical protein
MDEQRADALLLKIIWSTSLTAGLVKFKIMTTTLF